MEEARLIERARRGEFEAFETLVSQTEAKTYGQWLKRSQSLDSWAGPR